MCRRSACQTLLKSLRYIKCHSSSSPRPIKSPSNSIRCGCQKISSWSRRCENILDIRQKATFKAINQVTSKPKFMFFKDITNQKTNTRQKTNRVVVLSHTPLPSILKYSDYRCNLPAAWKTRFLQTHIEDFS